jgi:anthranilate phosphoribosyltransferase
MELARLYSYLFQETGKSFAIIHSLDGYDEISLTGEMRLITKSNDRIISPEEIGFSIVTAQDIRGGTTVADSVKIFNEVLDGKASDARTNVVLANAAMGIQCLHPQKIFADCIDMAKESLLSGKARQVVQKLISLQS